MWDFDSDGSFITYWTSGPDKQRLTGKAFIREMSDIDRSYRILGLTPGAPLEEIKRAYRDLARVWHPDRFPGDGRLQEKAQENLRRVNEAYVRLKDHAPPPISDASQTTSEVGDDWIGLGEILPSTRSGSEVVFESQALTEDDYDAATDVLAKARSSDDGEAVEPVGRDLLRPPPGHRAQGVTVLELEPRQLDARRARAAVWIAFAVVAGGAIVTGLVLLL